MPFFGNSPTGQTRRWIFAHNSSNDANSRKDVSFLSFVDMAPHLGGHIPQNPNFGGVNKRFQAKLAKSKNRHIVKTTAPIPTKFCIAIKTTKCPSWIVRIRAQTQTRRQAQWTYCCVSTTKVIGNEYVSKISKLYKYILLVWLNVKRRGNSCTFILVKMPRQLSRFALLRYDVHDDADIDSRRTSDN